MRKISRWLEIGAFKKSYFEKKKKENIKGKRIRLKESTCQKKGNIKNQQENLYSVTKGCVKEIKYRKRKRERERERCFSVHEQKTGLCERGKVQKTARERKIFFCSSAEHMASEKGKLQKAAARAKQQAYPAAVPREMITIPEAVSLGSKPCRTNQKLFYSPSPPPSSLPLLPSPPHPS